MTPKSRSRIVAASKEAERDANYHAINGVRAQFFVRGRPQPKGSVRAFMARGRPILTSTNKGLKGWEGIVAGELQHAWEGPPIDGSVHVSLFFQLVRPASVSAKKRPDPTVKPDLDKLARACLDAMTRIAFLDDAQVTSLFVLKRYDSIEGVHVIVQEMS